MAKAEGGPGRFAWIAVLCLLLGACGVIGNRFERQKPVESVEIGNQMSDLRMAGSTLSVTTWNIGYGGMGRESDFIFDGGKQRRPPSAALVDKNLGGISAFLSDDASDIVLLQEVPKPSWINYRRDGLAVVERAFPDGRTVFHADILTRGIPLPWRVEIGNATAHSVAASGFELIGLPLEPYFEFGLFRKNYRLHVMRLEGPSRWTVANLHLSAFDPEEVDVRRQQLRKVLEFGVTEYKAGRRVVLGGDWNLVLSPAAFPHRTPEEHFFWVRDFPRELLPEGWQIVADPRTPTVRLAHKPYEEGINGTIGIDGFIVSPNVQPVSVEAEHLNFEWSDHNPVRGIFRAK